MIVLFLAGLVAMIIMRTLHNDFRRHVCTELARSHTRRVATDCRGLLTTVEYRTFAHAVGTLCVDSSPLMAAQRRLAALRATDSGAS